MQPDQFYTGFLCHKEGLIFWTEDENLHQINKLIQVVDWLLSNLCSNLCIHSI